MNSLVAPNRPEELGHLLRTTLMLKVMSALTPGFCCPADRLHTNVLSNSHFRLGPISLAMGDSQGIRPSQQTHLIFPIHEIANGESRLFGIPD